MNEDYKHKIQNRIYIADAARLIAQIEGDEKMEQIAQDEIDELMYEYNQIEWRGDN